VRSADIVVLALLAGAGFLVWPLLTAPSRAAGRDGDGTAPDLRVLSANGADVPRHPLAGGAASTGVTDPQPVDAGIPGFPAIPVAVGATVTLGPGWWLTFRGYDDANRLAYWSLGDGGPEDTYGLDWSRRPQDYDWSAGYPQRPTSGPVPAPGVDYDAVVRDVQDIATFGVTNLADSLGIGETVRKVNYWIMSGLSPAGGAALLNGLRGLFR